MISNKFIKFFLVLVIVFSKIIANGQVHYYTFDKSLEYTDFKVIQLEITQRFLLNELLKYSKSDSVISRKCKINYEEILNDNRYLLSGYLLFLRDIKKFESDFSSDSNTYLVTFYKNEFVKNDTNSVFVGIDDGPDQNNLNIIKIKYTKKSENIELIEGDIFLSKDFLIRR